MDLAATTRPLSFSLRLTLEEATSAAVAAYLVKLEVSQVKTAEV